MTFYDVYIARADDPAYTRELDPWRDRNLANSPDALSPVLYDLNCFHRIVDMVGNGEVPGKQTDWGCWMAIADRKQVLEFFKDVRIPEEMAEFLQSLKDDQSYALVACES
jgi:hypothetical protein